MGLSCGARWSKSLLIMFNFVFWLSGCALLFVGIYTLVVKENKLLFRLFVVDGRDVFVQYLAWAFIAVGALIFLVGFCGCCGAMQESKCMLITYFIFLCIILAAELTFGIMALLFKEQTVDKLDNKLTKTLREEYGRNEAFSQGIDFAQVKFKCCGVHGPNDYAESRWRKEDLGKGANIVKTCCVLSNANQTDAYLEPKPLDNQRCQSTSPIENRDYRYTTGCMDKLKEFIRSKSKLFFGISIGVAILEVLGMILALCLAKEL